jgi:hypothetical protein
MKSRSIILAAIGGAALVAIPTTVAVAATPSDDAHPSIGWRSDNAPGRGIDNNAHLRMDAPGRGAGHQNSRGPNGMNLHDGIGDPAGLVAAGDTLSSVDTAALVFMVNEEKLAHDLYVQLGDAWDLRVFENISSAEQQHLDAVRSLLDAYGTEDPTAGLAAGEFSEPTLQDLYDTLLAEGLESSTQALAVGALVEETDIADLRDRSTDNEAMSTVFSALESGSENHLRAFVKNLSRAGVDYEAQVLGDAEVASLTGR